MRNAWDELSPETCQVLLCDLQEQIVARSKTTTPGALSASAEVLCKIAELFALPLTFSVVPEDDAEPKLIAPLKAFSTKENTLQRASASPFVDAATPGRLAAAKRPVLVLCGFATEVVVLHAALGALKAGYGVIVVADACGGMSERTETVALEQIREAGGVVSSVVSVATAMSMDFTTPVGQKMFEIVQALRLA